MRNTTIEILNKKVEIQELFDAYDIADPVTIVNVEKAIKEDGPAFEADLEYVLNGSSLQKRKRERTPSDGDSSNSGGGGGGNAMEWVNTIGGIVVPLTGSIIGGIRQPGGPLPTSQVQPYYETPTIQEAEKDANTKKVVIAVVVLFVVLIAGYLVMSKKNK
jgi:hypothetical protein